MRHLPSISISGSAYRRLEAATRARGVSMASIVEAACADLPPVDVEPREVLPVSHRIYAVAGKVARREIRPIADTIEAAILAAIDDAERYPIVARKKRRPMVAHANRSNR